MTLQTLGGLALPGADFSRPKPLLLLAYLALEGPQERRHLAELFWPGNADALNSLSVTLSRIRRSVPGAIEADEVRVWTRAQTDIEGLLAALEARDLEQSIRIYEGAFLDGVYLPDWSSELEEWVYAQREQLAARMRGVHLQLAEQAASRGNFGQAAKQAEQAYLLKSAPEPEPEDLRRLYPLLLAGKSPQATQVKREAEDLGITLSADPDEARAQFQEPLLGREKELKRLKNLPAGAWVWLRGGAGMGKSTLLKALHKTLIEPLEPSHCLPGRTGLPYATLEPLLSGALSEGEEVLLRKLAQLKGTLLLDGWEQTDPESQRLITRLRGLKPNLRVVVASRTDPAFEVDALLDLEPLSQEDLQPHPGAWEATGGLPALVGAHLRGEPLEAALETRMAALGATAREVGLALSLLEPPDLALVRRALGLGAAQMAQALDDLQTAGLMGPTGQVRVRQAMVEHLDGHPTLGANLAVKLARQKEGIEAFPLWQRARVLWEEGDIPQVEESYITWADELLRRGFPNRAVEVLTEAPWGERISFAKAKMLIRSHRFRDALFHLSNLPETPETLALRADVISRFGQIDEAEAMANRALSGSMEARAQAQQTLARIAFSKRNFVRAEHLYKQSGILWLALGQRLRWADTLNGQAVARSHIAAHATTAFDEALEAAKEYPTAKAMVLINIGKGHQRDGNFPLAEENFKIAYSIAMEAGALYIASLAQNNLGVLYHLRGNRAEANHTYQHALNLAQQTGDQESIGRLMANIAELMEDIDSWEDAVNYLEAAGYSTTATSLRSNMQAFRNKLQNA